MSKQLTLALRRHSITPVLLFLLLGGCAEDDEPALDQRRDASAKEPGAAGRKDAGARDARAAAAVDASGSKPGTRKPDAGAEQPEPEPVTPDESATSDDAGTADGQTAGPSDAGGVDPCVDPCPKAQGVDWLCQRRFMYGTNYAWHHFGSDFGGNPRWNQLGVSKNAEVERELAEMAGQGVNVLRWWIFPDFRGDGVSFDARDQPVGLGGTAVADLERALELADEYDLYLMLTLFSFDNFRPTREMDGLLSRSIRPLVVDTAARAGLVDRVVRPIARTVAQSPHSKRVIAWDVINEPEWAITGASAHGDDPPFDPNPELEAVTHAEMETFLRDVITGLRAESSALVSVGGAAIKWRYAWSKLDVDFHQFHIYDWVNQYFPYSRSPTEYGVSDRPVVMGEFPSQGLTGVSYTKLVESWYENGYAGSLSWAYSDTMFGGNLPELSSFAKSHQCETRYGPSTSGAGTMLSVAQHDERPALQSDPDDGPDTASRVAEIRELVQRQHIVAAHAKLQQLYDLHPGARDLPVLERLTGYHLRPMRRQHTR